MRNESGPSSSQFFHFLIFRNSQTYLAQRLLSNFRGPNGHRLTVRLTNMNHGITVSLLSSRMFPFQFWPNMSPGPSTSKSLNYRAKRNIDFRSMTSIMLTPPKRASALPGPKDLIPLQGLESCLRLILLRFRDLLLSNGLLSSVMGTEVQLNLIRLRHRSRNVEASLLSMQWKTKVVRIVKMMMRRLRSRLRRMPQLLKHFARP